MTVEGCLQVGALVVVIFLAVAVGLNGCHSNCSVNQPDSAGLQGFTPHYFSSPLSLIQGKKIRDLTCLN